MKRFLRLETLIAILLGVQIYILYEGFSVYQSRVLDPDVRQEIFRLGLLHGLLLLVVLLMLFRSLRRG